jgi:hypothetical protein
MKMRNPKIVLLALLLAGAPTASLADVEVDIDIDPTSDKNLINLNSNGHISVAILGSTSFDVADVGRLAFGPNGARPVDAIGWKFKDENGDGLTDLVTAYQIQETGISSGEVEACLTGKANIGGTPTSFWGCDAIQPVFGTPGGGGCGIGFELAFLLPPLMWLRQRRRWLR